MKGFASRFESLFSAITFAEVGEFDTARKILRDEERPRVTDRPAPVLRARKELKAPGLKRK